MAKKKLTLSQMKKASEEAAEAMEGTNKKTEKPTKDKTEYRTVRINVDLHFQLKIEAFKHKMNITEYLEKVLEEKFNIK